MPHAQREIDQNSKLTWVPRKKEMDEVGRVIASQSA
jgi:hypothetical protein